MEIKNIWSDFNTEKYRTGAVRAIGISIIFRRIVVAVKTKKYV